MKILSQHSTLGLLACLLAAPAHAAFLNPVVLPSCPTQGIYQEVDDSGSPNPTEVWFVPYRITLDPAADSLSVFSWQESEEDWISISMNLRLTPSENWQKCVQTAFPDHSLKEVKTSQVNLQFLSPSTAYAAEVNGGSHLDLFEKAQWISLTMHGKDLHKIIKNKGDSFSFRAFLRGVVLWELPYEIAGVKLLRQYLTFAVADEARLNSFVKEAMNANP